MEDLNRENLIEISKKNLNEFLARESRSLSTYTRDPSLMYIADENLEKFKLSPKNKTLYMPLVEFLERNLDREEILWHIYFELALYPDWKENTKVYINREKYWKDEIDNMTLFMLKKAKREKVDKDEAYQPSVVYNFVKNEILNFLFEMDLYTKFLRVKTLCPIYRDREVFDDIIVYLKKDKKYKNLEKYSLYEAFSMSFIYNSLNKSEITIDENILNPREDKIFYTSFYTFIEKNLSRIIVRDEGVIKRDLFIKTFVYPYFEAFFKEALNREVFYHLKGKKDEKAKTKSEKSKKEKDDSLNSDREDLEKVLKDMAEEDKDLGDNKSSKSIKLEMDKNSLNKKDEEIFSYYSNKMKSQRDEMQKFWLKLIGDAKKEVSVKNKNQEKGKLDIDSLINYYPNFFEAEKKGNYKNLPIFSRYLLEKKSNILPEKIEISFVIDNSGSMDDRKIDAARKALSVTLLSLEDFNNYLKANGERLNQKVEVLSETWFFGSDFYNIKKFKNKSSKDDDKDIVNSIVKLDAKDGATDDAKCLKKIYEDISSKDKMDLKTGKLIKIIFEITDGASSFPGLTKDVVKDLLGENIEVYAFQIGKNSEKSKNTFDFIWNEGLKEKRGIKIGENVETLPKNLLEVLQDNMNKIFKR